MSRKDTSIYFLFTKKQQHLMNNINHMQANKGHVTLIDYHIFTPID